VPLGRAEAARTALERATERLPNPADLPRCYYLLAMLHARFLPAPDLARAEDYLQRGLGLVAEADMPEPDRHFLSVFIMNGLALVRLRQRRVPEALELCRAGVSRLNQHLDAHQHRLHRSVLLFNIAQVHAQIGPYEDALSYFTQAMAMDPNYSEYYNDRGAVSFRMDRLAEAESDYLRATELSPPYAEVWVNLGQCYRVMDRMQDAVAAYSRALDLDPTSTLATVGRADAYSVLGHVELALSDYERALAMDPAQPLVLASRAILHYDTGRLVDAVEDLDAAVALAPDVADLYQNRAVALRELGRSGEAAEDLNRYLSLSPDAEDRAQVQGWLYSIEGAR
jgi:tetratricopeptide (TPR) repeat protein